MPQQIWMDTLTPVAHWCHSHVVIKQKAGCVAQQVYHHQDTESDQQQHCDWTDIVS